MAHNLGSFATPSNNFMREPIAQPEVATAEYEIKPNLVSMVQQDQFGGSAFEDDGMHLHNFTELCNMRRIRDYDPWRFEVASISERKSKRMASSFTYRQYNFLADCCSKF